MHAIVVERKADHDRIHAEHPLEITDERDRAALPDHDRLLAPFGGQGGARLDERRVVEWKLDRRRAAEVPELHLAVDRQAGTRESRRGSSADPGRRPGGTRPWPWPGRVSRSWPPARYSRR